ncbi:hypothetical protein CBR_g3168 [Chara braunii]|uniref:Mitochondrial import inner membrane translocase subunit n=1 Tax=Chara braunii TaxID=69332 RepID=A0A388KF40_CHABU|nr:hypothetical protein CBR_g3168 [Chara braunii]|eukprot:GBG68627.1 hypothetical protein CBR_g3168 [Chara braunii]
MPKGGEEAVNMAQQEMEFRVDMFSRLTAACFEKCIGRSYKDSELNVGENSCIDRCVAKYWQVTGIVGQMLGGAQFPGK